MKPPLIAIAGNPNSGKTTLFNALTGLRQKVGNYPGVTVEQKEATIQLANKTSIRLLDLPGIYSLYPSSEDEEISCNVLTGNGLDAPDKVIVVVDTSHIQRGLLICTQLIDLQIPTVLVLNKTDAAVWVTPIFIEKLSQQLGIPVVALSARQQTGIAQLLEELAKPISSPQTPFFKIPPTFIDKLVSIRLEQKLPSVYHAYLKVIQGKEKSTLAIPESEKLIANELLVRHDKISQFIQSGKQAIQNSWSERIDRVLLHPIWGYVSLIFMLFLLFQTVFIWAAYPMDWIDGGFAAGGDWMESQLPDIWLTSLFVKGVWAGFQGIIVFVPQIALLFFFLALLEETGLMARTVFMSDRLMRFFGLSGKSVVPLLGGFACAVPSIMAARTIPSKRERLITMMITPLMACSARIPVYTVLIAIFIPSDIGLGWIDGRGLWMSALYLIGFIAALGIAWCLKPRNYIQQDAEFVIELPSYRNPRWLNVGIEVYIRCKTFVLQAGQVILFLSVILWFLMNFGSSEHQAITQKYDTLKAGISDTSKEKHLEWSAHKNAELLQTSYAGQLGKIFEPLITPLGYDWKIGIALISSFAAREVFVSTMNTLYATGTDGEEGYQRLTERLKQEQNPVTGKPMFSIPVTVSLLLFYAFAMQCISTLAVVKRETHSWKWAGILFVYQGALAYLVSFAAFQILFALHF